MRALDEGGTARLLETFAGSRLYTPLLIAVTTGLRRGELLGLRWRDIQWDAGQLSVVQALEQTRSGVMVKQPKTARGRRTIALPQLAIEMLKRHKAQQAAEWLAFGLGYQDNGLVFASHDDSPWEPGSRGFDLPSDRSRFSREKLPFMLPLGGC